MNKLVSVIMPTHKRTMDVLSRAINSVLSQSYTNIELIIVDDNPLGDFKDNIAREIKTINDCRITLLQHETNKGACAARNTGIEHSKGDYIGFLDDDDEWLPEKLQLQLAKFSDERVGLVYCDSYTINIKNNIETGRTTRSYRVSGMVFDELLDNNFIGSTSFVLLRKKSIELCGSFNNYLLASQDYELWLRISKKYRVDYVSVPLVNYYAHDGERISTNIDNKIQAKEKVIDLHKDDFVSRPKLYSRRVLTLVPYYQRKYGRKDAILKWWEGTKIFPFHTGVIKSFVRIIFNIS